jgi:cysteine synthase A
LKAQSILHTIGNTPHIRLNRMFPDHEVWLKQERANPGGSIKDRIALAMIETAEANGELEKDGVIIEPTSGNTGIGLAMVAAVKGYRLILIMPEFVLTPKELGMKGALAKATELIEKTPGGWMPQQFANPANLEVHRKTTGPEIIADFPDGLDYMITGVGTGGHITGCAEVMKEAMPALKVFAVEPALSPVLSGGDPGPHPIQGIGAGFVPDIMDVDILDGVLQVDPEHAKEMARRAAREEGMLIGLSSGATLAAIENKLADVPSGASVLGFCYDTGERYLSVPDFLPTE